MIDKKSKSVLLTYPQIHRFFKVCVIGTSMLPDLKSGDCVIATPSSEYKVGDIVVFLYGADDIIIHRIVKIDERFYYCKGDNAFGVERVSEKSILGKAVLINSVLIPEWPNWKMDLSFVLACKFYRCNCDITEIRKLNLYKLYSDVVLRAEMPKTLYHVKKESCSAIKSEDIIDKLCYLLSSPCSKETLLTIAKKQLQLSMDDVYKALFELVLIDEVDVLTFNESSTEDI